MTSLPLQLHEKGTKTKNFKLISQIKPQDIGWICKVVVVEKTTQCRSQDGKRMYQHVWLKDIEENKVLATIFDPNIKALEDTLIPLKTYNISNAYVKKTEE